MNDKNGLRAWRDRFFRRVRVEVVRGAVNVYEHRRRSRVADAICRGNERKAGTKTVVARTDSGRHHSEMQRRSTGRHGDGMLSADIFGEASLEFFDTFSLAEPPAAQHLQNCFFLFLANERARDGNDRPIQRADSHPFSSFSSGPRRSNDLGLREAVKLAACTSCTAHSRPATKNPYGVL